MTAVATKPRKSAPKLPGAPAPAVYKRPESTYHPAIGKTAEERIATLRATLSIADGKLEIAYEAAEPGSASAQLLDLIAHDLMYKMREPIESFEDGPPKPVSKRDITQVHIQLFGVIAALEGAMALSLGAVFYPTLVEAFHLLDWAQDECDSTALGALLPAQPPAPPKQPPDTEAENEADKPSDEAYGHYQHALAVVEAAAQNNADDTEHSALIYAARNLMRRDADPLFEALTGTPDADALNDASAALSVVIGLLEAAAFANDDSCLWGARTLAELSKTALDDHIEKVEFPGAAS